MPIEICKVLESLVVWQGVNGKYASGKAKRKDFDFEIPTCTY